MSPRITLSELLDGLATVPQALSDRIVFGLSQDSRRITPGVGFVALAGSRSHGLDYVAAVRAQGAACILFEPPLPDGLAASDDLVPVPELRAKLGVLANRYYGTPSTALQVIGVTGTNGKTSTVQLLAQALQTTEQGPCGHIGTLGLGLAAWQQSGERTTPDVLSVHAALNTLRVRGARSVAMEVSSHALQQGRVDGVQFALAVFTNLTRDHLDYHGDMQAYGEAKARLFLACRPEAAVINIDDPFGAALLSRLDPQLPVWPVSACGDSRARLSAEQIELDAKGLRFVLREAEHCHRIRCGLLGRFNIDNLLAVAASLRALGLSLEQTVDRLQALQPVNGRMNRISDAPQQPLVVVDYAHTPDALEQALRSLRGHTVGRLICVFGCGGERDRGKRPQMARIAESLADQVIVTDDNPRNENGDAIVAEILAGFAVPEGIVVLRDRERAIAAAINQAAANDTVLIAGKGHETYQEVGSQRRPFDDAAIARRLLQERAA